MRWCQLLRNLDGLDDVALFDGVHHIFPGFHFAKHGVLSVEMRSSDVSDKELAAVGAGSGIGHGKRARGVGQVLFAFISKVIARTAAASAGGIAALDHEVGNYAMEDNAIVKAIFGKENKIVHRFGCVGCIEFANNIAA